MSRIASLALLIGAGACLYAAGVESYRSWRKRGRDDDDTPPPGPPKQVTAGPDQPGPPKTGQESQTAQNERFVGLKPHLGMQAARRLLRY